MVEKPIDSDYSSLNVEIESNHEDLKFQVAARFKITKHISIFSKDFTENWSNKTFVIDSVLNTDP